MAKIVVLGTDNFEGLKYTANICRIVNDELGDNRGADVMFKGLDYSKIKDVEKTGDYDRVAQIFMDNMMELGDSVDRVKWLFPHQGMHRYVKIIEEKFKAMGMPVSFLHSGDSIAYMMKQRGIRLYESNVLLIGTRPVMEEDFLAKKFRGAHMNVITPRCEERTIIHDTIMNDLVMGVAGAEQKAIIHGVVNETDEAHVVVTNHVIDALLLGCGQLCQVAKDGDFRMPVIDCVEAQINHTSDIIINDYVKAELAPVDYPSLKGEDYQNFSLATVRALFNQHKREGSQMDGIGYAAMNELHRRMVPGEKPKRMIKELK